MTTQEIYKLASELTNQEINNVLAGWKSGNDTESIRTFETLVSLGDSKGIAMASTIAEKQKKQNQDDSLYRTAYLS